MAKYLDYEGVKALWSKVKNLVTGLKGNIENGTVIANKATNDGSGRNIASTYLKIESKGAANGIASLDATGKVPSSQLPSFVDDVLEYTAKANFPSSGEGGKIYVDLSTSKTYRWGGSSYAVISDTLAIGKTAGTAYEGNNGLALETRVTSVESDLSTKLNYRVVSSNYESNFSNAGSSAGFTTQDTGRLASKVQTTLSEAGISYTADSTSYSKVLVTSDSAQMMVGSLVLELSSAGLVFDGEELLDTSMNISISDIDTICI